MSLHKKIFTTFFITGFLFVSPTFASRDSQNKASLVLETILSNQSQSAYQNRAKQLLRGNVNTVVQVEDFENKISSPYLYHQVIDANSQPELIKRLRIFISKNDLENVSIGYASLNTTQNMYLNILFLVELRKLIIDRPDLHLFGTKTVKNLNEAIGNRIKYLYVFIDRSSHKLIYRKKIAERMERNFLEALAYDMFLSPTEQWVNEFVGLSKTVNKNNTKQVLESILDVSDRKTILKLKRSGPFCGDLFA